MGSSKKSKGVGSPSTLTFKAGGKKGTRNHDQPNKESKSPSMIRPPPPSSSSSRNKNNKDHTHHHTHITTSSLPSIIQTGLTKKRSPFQIKSWIACVLTLDGRDKFTKLLQYTSRLLCWYFAVLSKKESTTAIGGIIGSVVGAVGGTVGANVGIQQQYFMALSKRFESLYKSLVTSRKAFRLGRSIIEVDKLSSMGWGDYLGYMLLHPLAEGAGDNNGDDNGLEEKKVEGMMEFPTGSASTSPRYDTHPILEEEDESNDDESSWDEDDEQSVDSNDNGDCSPRMSEEKKYDDSYDPIPSSTKTKDKVVSRPGRPKLPSRISSNVGWGPSNTTTTTDDAPMVTKQSSTKPPARTVSEMGRQMYQPFPSRSSSMGSYKQVKDNNATTSTTSPGQPSIPSSILSTTPTTTPAYKLIGGTIKLLGLMGFWAFDNLSFLTTSGFLDPIRSVSGNDSTDGIIVDAKSNTRMQRKKRASEYACKFYYLGVVAGLYVNARALWDHRRGMLKAASTRLNDAHYAKDTDEAVVAGAQAHLQQTKQKHFELMLALLKSSCDLMVFSNNPGIDLYLKLWGKKNHEGLHCLGGLISASTVLYNNFPNAK